MAAIDSEAVDPSTVKTSEEPTERQFQFDHRKSFVSRVDFRFSLKKPIEAKDLALSKTNFVWLRVNAKKFYGHRTTALDRCVPRDLSLCLAKYDNTPFAFTNDWSAPLSSSGTGRPGKTKNTNRFLRLGRYDPFEARGSYEIIEAPEVRCSSIVDELERKQSFPDRLSTADFNSALRKCLVAAYVRDRWDGLKVDEAFEKFTKDQVEKLKGMEKEERNLCVGWKQQRKSSPTPGTNAEGQSPQNTTSTNDNVTLPKLPTRRLLLCSPGKQSEWKVRYWDTRVLDRMVMSGKSK